MEVIFKMCILIHTPQISKLEAARPEKCFYKSSQSLAQWHTSVIPASQEAEAVGPQIQCQFGQLSKTHLKMGDKRP